MPALSNYFGQKRSGIKQCWLHVTLVTPSLIFDKYLSARQEGVRKGLGRGQKGARRGPGGS